MKLCFNKNCGSKCYLDNKLRQFLKYDHDADHEYDIQKRSKASDVFLTPAAEWRSVHSEYGVVAPLSDKDEKQVNNCDYRNH